MTLKKIKNVWYCDDKRVPDQCVRVVRLCNMLTECIDLNIDRLDIMCHLLRAYKQLGVDVEKGRVQLRDVCGYLVLVEGLMEKCSAYISLNLKRFPKHIIKFMDNKGFILDVLEPELRGGYFLDYRKGV